MAAMEPSESVEQVMFGEAPASSNPSLAFTRASSMMPPQGVGSQASASSSVGLASLSQDPLAILQRLGQFVQQCASSLPADCWRQLQQGARDADALLAVQLELTHCQAQRRGAEASNQELQQVLKGVRDQLAQVQRVHRSSMATNRNLLSEKDHTISELTKQVQQRDKTIKVSTKLLCSAASSI